MTISYNPAAAPAIAVSMGDIARAMWQRKWLPISLLLLGLLAGWLLNSSIQPKYETEAQLILERGAVLPTEDGEPAPPPQPVTDREVQDQIKFLQSRDFASKIVKKLDLENDPEFGSTQLGFIGSWLVRLGFKDDPNLKSKEQQVIDALKSGLTIYQQPQSNMIGIKYSSSDPETTKRIANAVADQFMFSAKEEQSGSAGRTREWLSNQIEELRTKVTAGERRAEEFRAEKGLLRGERDTLTTQQVSEINSQITIAETSKAEADARLRAVKSSNVKNGGRDNIDVLNSPLIQNLVQREQEAKSKLAELSATYLGNHPKLIAAKNDVQAITRLIRVEAHRFTHALQGQALVASERLKSLKRQLTNLKTEKAGDGLDDVKLRTMERDNAADRTLLESLLARYAKANASQTTPQPSVARLIQRADKPSSVLFPRIGPLLLLTSLAGLMAGLGLSFMSSIMDAMGRARTFVPQAAKPASSSTEQIVETPVSYRERVVESPISHRKDVGENPVSHRQRTQENSSEGRVVQQSTATEAVRERYVETLAAVPQNVLRVVERYVEKDAFAASHSGDALTYIVSTIESDIKANGVATATFTRVEGEIFDAAAASIAAARKLASDGRKVLLIDVDHTHNAVQNLLGIGEGIGLSEATKDMNLFQRIVAKDPSSSVHIIRFGSLKDVESQHRVASSLGKILGSLSDIYSVVLLHSGKATPMSPQMLRHFKMAFLLSPNSNRRSVTLAADTLVEQGVSAVHFVELPDHNTTLKSSQGSSSSPRMTSIDRTQEPV